MARHPDPERIFEARRAALAFRGLLERAGLPRIRFHDLRHTAATLLLASGTHPKLVQELLGHSSIAMTLDVYSHVTPSMHDETANTMDRILAR
jgi:integrase